MKKIFLFIGLITNLSISQNLVPNSIVYKGCECAIQPEICFENKLADLIKSNIKHIDITKSVKSLKTRALLVNTIITFKADGTVLEYSINTNNKRFDLILKNSLDNVQNINISPKKLHNNIYTISHDFVFTIKKQEDRRKQYGYDLNPIYKNYDPLDVIFKDDHNPTNNQDYERVPVFSGCDQNMCNEELKKCMSEKISKFIGKNFDASIGANLGLPNGKVKMFITFKINKEGDIVDIKVDAPHIKLENEVIRVLNLIPKFDSAGFQRKRYVTVPYSLPLYFAISN